MLSELNGAGPVLLALTGENELGRAKKKGKWLNRLSYVSPLALSIRAAKASKAALMRKRAANIEKAKIERANRARKLAEARARQVAAEKAAREARTEEQRAAALEQRESAMQNLEEVQSSPVEIIDETADSPADEMETIEEGVEDTAEAMGYSKSNDDYFVGAAALSKPIRAIAKKTSGQLQIVKKPATSKKTLYIVGGAALAAFLFRKQLKRAFR